MRQDGTHLAGAGGSQQLGDIAIGEHPSGRNESGGFEHRLNVVIMHLPSVFNTHDVAVTKIVGAGR